MKVAINNDGIEVEVSDDTIVNTINGVHYLLTLEEQEEFDANALEWANTEEQRREALIDAKIKLAYQAESDPLFFKYQRGEATKQEWLDKVAEIQQRIRGE